jgi:hypothetical protein
LNNTHDTDLTSGTSTSNHSPQQTNQQNDATLPPQPLSLIIVEFKKLLLDEAEKVDSWYCAQESHGVQSLVRLSACKWGDIHDTLEDVPGTVTAGTIDKPQTNGAEINGNVGVDKEAWCVTTFD